MWEWQSETYVLKQQGHFYDMNVLSYSPDGQIIATGGDDGKVGCLVAGQKVVSVSSKHTHAHTHTHTHTHTTGQTLEHIFWLLFCHLHGPLLRHLWRDLQCLREGGGKLLPGRNNQGL